jgi:hypothetical protein
MSPTLNHMPLFAPSGDNVASVAAQLSMLIKGVAFRVGKAPDVNQNLTGEPAIYINDNWHVGFIAILDALERHSPEPSLFPNGNRGMPIALKYWSEQFLADGEDADAVEGHLSLIARQMEDGRDFLQGGEPGLADILSFAPVVILKNRGVAIMELITENPSLVNWCQRMQDIQGT